MYCVHIIYTRNPSDFIPNDVISLNYINYIKKFRDNATFIMMNS